MESLQEDLKKYKEQLANNTLKQYSLKLKELKLLDLILETQSHIAEKGNN